MNQKIELLCIWMKVDLPKICPVDTVMPTRGSVAMVFRIDIQRSVSMPWLDLFVNRWAF
jgi:hypothetical protein